MQHADDAYFGPGNLLFFATGLKLFAIIYGTTSYGSRATEFEE